MFVIAPGRDAICLERLVLPARQMFAGLAMSASLRSIFWTFHGCFGLAPAVSRGPHRVPAAPVWYDQLAVRTHPGAVRGPWPIGGTAVIDLYKRALADMRFATARYGRMADTTGEIAVAVRADRMTAPVTWRTRPIEPCFCYIVTSNSPRSHGRC